MSPRPFIGIVTASVLATAGACALAVDATPGYGPWQASLKTIESAGFDAVDEFERRSTGGFTAEVSNAEGQSFDLQLSAAGELVDRRLRRSAPDTHDLLSMAQTRAVLAWVQTEGYPELHSVSGDNGRIEAEAIDADGRAWELEIVTEEDGFRLLHRELD